MHYNLLVIESIVLITILDPLSHYCNRRSSPIFGLLARLTNSGHCFNVCTTIRAALLWNWGSRLLLSYNLWQRKSWALPASWKKLQKQEFRRREVLCRFPKVLVNFCWTREIVCELLWVLLKLDWVEFECVMFWWTFMDKMSFFRYWKCNVKFFETRKFIFKISETWKEYCKIFETCKFSIKFFEAWEDCGDFFEAWKYCDNFLLINIPVF